MYSIDKNIDNTIILKKSKFITKLYRADSIEEINNILNSIKSEYQDATHICYGYILSEIEKCSDDGEPSKTAGIPILNVLKKNNLTNVLAIVIRYFGGIKLGAGGLIRAYGNSVSEAIKQATIMEDIPYNKYQIVLSYEMANKVNPILMTNTLKLDADYDENVTFSYVLKDENINNKIVEITRGLVPACIGKEIIQKVIK